MGWHFYRCRGRGGTFFLASSQVYAINISKLRLCTEHQIQNYKEDTSNIQLQRYFVNLILKWKIHSQYRFTFKTIINFYFSFVIFQMAQFIKWVKILEETNEEKYPQKNCTDSGERFVLCHLPAMATIHCSPLCTTDLFPPQKVEWKIKIGCQSSSS